MIAPIVDRRAGSATTSSAGVNSNRSSSAPNTASSTSGAPNEAVVGSVSVAVMAGPCLRGVSRTRTILDGPPQGGERVGTAFPQETLQDSTEPQDRL